jgi:hypothetical protein
MIDIPGDPLTKRGLNAASQWAIEGFREFPSCRLVFESGYAYGWMTYNTLYRYDKVTKARIDKAVAIETAVTDEQGRRFVHSVPINADGVMGIAAEMHEKRQKRINKLYTSSDW